MAVKYCTSCKRIVKVAKTLSREECSRCKQDTLILQKPLDMKTNLSGYRTKKSRGK